MAEPQLVRFAKVVAVDLIRQGAVAADYCLGHLVPVVHDGPGRYWRASQPEGAD